MKSQKLRTECYLPKSEKRSAHRNEAGVNIGTKLYTGTGWSSVLSNNRITIDRDSGIHKSARQNDSKEFHHKEISI